MREYKGKMALKFEKKKKKKTLKEKKLRGTISIIFT